MLTLLERQLHLAEMGVPQWYSRLNLLGAAQSPDSVYLIADNTVVSEGEGGLRSNQIEGESVQSVISDQGPVDSQSSVSGARDLLVSADLASKQKPSENIAQEPSGASIQAGLQDEVSSARAKVVEQSVPVAGDVLVSALSKFALSMYKTENNCLIISEGSHEGVVDAELSLLRNILSVCSFISPGVVQSCQFEQSFNWPVFQSSNLQSKQDAPLNQVLKKWVSPFHGCDKGVLLYFGAEYEGVRKLIELDISEQPASNCVLLAFKHSLSDLLRLPAGKADIWNDLSACLLNENNE